MTSEGMRSGVNWMRAKRIDIAVDLRGGTDARPAGISVSIQDDGVGFDPPRVRGRGLGLVGMQERVMDLGGELTISSQPFKGTVVSAKLPLHQEVATGEHSNSVG